MWTWFRPAPTRDSAAAVHTPDLVADPLLDAAAAALAWIVHAHGATPDGGMTAGLDGGAAWRPSTVPVTAATLTTLLSAPLARWDGRTAVAGPMIEWLLTRQHASGAFAQRWTRPAPEGDVSATGAALEALLAAQRSEPYRDDLRQAIASAATWLLDALSDDGQWRVDSGAGLHPTFDARAALALFRAGAAQQSTGWQLAATAHMDWALGAFGENAWHAAWSCPPRGMRTDELISQILALDAYGAETRLPLAQTLAQTAIKKMLAELQKNNLAAPLFFSGWTPVAQLDSATARWALVEGAAAVGLLSGPDVLGLLRPALRGQRRRGPVTTLGSVPDPALARVDSAAARYPVLSALALVRAVLALQPAAVAIQLEPTHPQTSAPSAADPHAMWTDQP